MSAGSSYADSPALTPIIYDPKRPKSRRWSLEGPSASTIPRMYHSTAILLNDGCIFVTRSNPNADVVPLADRYGTEYRVEKFFPPEPFTVELSKDDVRDAKHIETIIFTYVRPGYSTHDINISQRAIKLK
ncbi:hypothetical protein B0T18DRAFT_385080 [Schizothecium vesticola]|uniref:Glyoxal oxidase N-terminal domain-containing protein n=1 Tax=Schizothecium vesticola TaxID=314040 RepID=A0AA40F818_9PEZI|nr:hypothetical protein B0T18DRAFT_385080 [Schizothecium vesticola]